QRPTLDLVARLHSQRRSSCPFVNPLPHEGTCSFDLLTKPTLICTAHVRILQSLAAPAIGTPPFLHPRRPSDCTRCAQTPKNSRANDEGSTSMDGTTALADPRAEQDTEEAMAPLCSEAGLPSLKKYPKSDIESPSTLLALSEGWRAWVEASSLFPSI